jgi:hypothetical protein
MALARWLGFGLVVVAACGTARLIHQDQEGGIIQLDGDRGQALNDAALMMTQQCGPGNFHLLSQGEEPIGTTTTSDGSAQEVRPVVAWRIHYVCGRNGP